MSFIISIPLPKVTKMKKILVKNYVVYHASYYKKNYKTFTLPPIFG